MLHSFDVRVRAERLPGGGEDACEELVVDLGGGHAELFLQATTSPEQHHRVTHVPDGSSRTIRS